MKTRRPIETAPARKASRSTAMLPVGQTQARTQPRAARNGAALFATTALVGSLWATAVPAEPAQNALPNGGVVSAGQSTITSNGANMTVTQGTARSAINWNSYNIGSG